MGVLQMNFGATPFFFGIAKELNAQKIKTARDGKWHPSSVKRLMERLIQTQFGKQELRPWLDTMSTKVFLCLDAHELVIVSMI